MPACAGTPLAGIVVALELHGGRELRATGGTTNMRKLMILSLAALGVAAMATMAVATEKSGAKHSTSQKVMGEVTAIDAGARTVSIKENVKGGTTKDMSFAIADNAKVSVHGKPGALADIKAGDAVTIKHMMKDGKDLAEEIAVAPPAKSSSKTAKPAKG